MKERKGVRGTRVAPERPTACNDWLQACRERQSVGGGGAHLQWRVLYCHTDAAINHRECGERREVGQGRMEVWKNERKRAEMLQGVQRLRVIVAICATDAKRGWGGVGVGMDLLRPVIHQ